MPVDAHQLAFLDWLACAVRGAREPAAVAARAAGDGLLERVTAVGTAGHVLDFDDTYAPGLAHLSAATAPAALVLAADHGASIGDALAAHAAGFEAMAVLARTCHPALYDGGWHPTAVCGGAGAAVAAARLLGLDARGTRTAIALALLRAGGLRAAFGSDGKALQVGLAAAAGVHAALLAQAGASVDAERAVGGADGFAAAFGVAVSAATIDEMLAAADAAVTPAAPPPPAVAAAPPSPAPAADAAAPLPPAVAAASLSPAPAGGTAAPSPPAVAENWIKAYPCCLQTHAAIDAALSLGVPPPPGATIVVAVHPLSHQAASLDAVRDGLEAKFSIPYLTAYALLHGAPDLASFEAVDEDAAALGARIEVRADGALGQSEACLELDGDLVARISAPRGSPDNPLGAEDLTAKVSALAGDALNGAFGDLEAPAVALLRRAGI